MWPLSLAKFFGQIWVNSGKVWVNLPKFGQIRVKFGQHQNLASPKTFDFLRL